MAVRPRTGHERCDYCYWGRVVVASKHSEARHRSKPIKVDLSQYNCICSATQPCRDPMCAHYELVGEDRRQRNR